MMEGQDEYEQNQIVELGQFLAELRREQGLSQRDLAAKLNTRQCQVSKIEQGQIATFKFSTLQQWGRALGYRIEIHLAPIEDVEREAFNANLASMLNELEEEDQTSP